MLLKLNEETKTLLISLDDIEATYVAVALGRYEDTINDYPTLKHHIHEMAIAILSKSIQLNLLLNESEEFNADTQ